MSQAVHAQEEAAENAKNANIPLQPGSHSFHARIPQPGHPMNSLVAGTFHLVFVLGM